jgi:hypothetical protein
MGLVLIYPGDNTLTIPTEAVKPSCCFDGNIVTLLNKAPIIRTTTESFSLRGGSLSVSGEHQWAIARANWDSHFGGICMSTRIELVVGVWITGLLALLGLSYALVRPKSSMSKAFQASASQTNTSQANTSGCQTIAADPKPPLNVRSSPRVTADNIVGTLGNGTVMAVTDRHQGWLHLKAPIKGWVYQSLTVTSCPRLQAKVQTAPDPDLRTISLKVIDKSQEYFQAGQLQAAQAMLQTIPASDFTYPQAQAALQTMKTQWQQGQQAYQSAQTAMQKGRGQDVLVTVKQVPDIRYWRQKMAPIVKQAIQQQARTL